MPAYRPLRPPRHDTRRVRGLDIHLTHWGPVPTPAAPALFLLHGWQDTGDTFQFLVDGFREDWPCVALDWRGFGRSEVPQDGYWFADYLADLEDLLDQLSPGVPARLVGHSMGGNIASLYAGARPDRVRCIVNLEGFGIPRTVASQAPAQLRKWLDQVKAPPMLKNYDSFEQLCSIIALRYPRFSPAQADFVTRAWSKLGDDGRMHLLGDPRHRRVSPAPYQREHAEAIWRLIRAPMLLLLARESEYLPRLGADGSEEALQATFATGEIVHIEDAGHMLHIERADVVAPLVERFLSAH